MITWTCNEFECVAAGVGYSVVLTRSTWRVVDRNRPTAFRGFRSAEAAKRQVAKLVEMDIEAAQRWGSWRGLSANALRAATEARLENRA